MDRITEIETKNVIRLIEQFLREQNLQNSLSQLQSESGISLNAIENKNQLHQYIIEGCYDSALELLDGISLEPEKLINLYELMFHELMEMKESGVARALLRQSEPLSLLKQIDPDRYLALETALVTPVWKEKDVFGEEGGKVKRRIQVAKELCDKHLISIERDRLVTLLAIGAKGNFTSASNLDESLLEDSSIISYNPLSNEFYLPISSINSEEDILPDFCFTSVKFEEGSYAETCLFSPDGRFFVTGSSDGFIEVWNELTGKIRLDLDYQQREAFMSMDEPIVSLAFSPDSKRLISGGMQGTIQVWNIETGACLCKLASSTSSSEQQSKPVLCASFASLSAEKSSTHIISGHYDGLLRVHGLNSHKVLHSFSVHGGSPVTSLHHLSHYTWTGGMNSLMISAGLSGRIVLSQGKSLTDSTSQSSEVIIKSDESSQPSPITSLHPIPGRSGKLFVALSPPRSVHIIAITTGSAAHPTLKINATWKCPVKAGSQPPDLVAAIPSRYGKFIYALSETGDFYVFDLATCSTVASKPIKLPRKADWIGMCQHPNRNILVIYGRDGQCLFFRPSETAQ